MTHVFKSSSRLHEDLTAKFRVLINAIETIPVKGCDDRFGLFGANYCNLRNTVTHPIPCYAVLNTLKIETFELARTATNR